MRGEAGVYRITFRLSRKVYIGRSVDVPKRWAHHRWHLIHGKHRNVGLQAAWKAHGPDAFTWEVIRLVEGLAAVALDAALAEAEMAALADHPNNFNLMGAGELGLTASPGTRAKLSDLRKAMWADPAYKERLRESHRRKNRDDPEWASRRSAAIAVAKGSLENRAKVAEHSRALWATEHRRRQSEKRKAKWEDPAYRAKQTAARKASWADPEVRAKRSAALRAGRAKRKADKATEQQ